MLWKKKVVVIWVQVTLNELNTYFLNYQILETTKDFFSYVSKFLADLTVMQ